ncbi:DUF1326 domain-containing protein [Natrinema ejinorense]|uniref:DUF1326 domain-containing protein n=1 Tax=Natrinema ejinorense TaxID=373386 RepID=A0A2A5QVJ7_9EURY|nr:DUF1326 domain-containing protein [Natrinema ejinorense]PCR90871.1 hypothetical protein CP557_10290 [Natrinema ejinorense]
MPQDWTIEGEYVETCNCDVACQCLWLEPPDDDACTASLAWKIRDGQYGPVDLSGLHVAMLARSEAGVMFDPDVAWQMVLLVDETASSDQQAAIEDIYLGRAGGIFAALADTHVERAEVTTAPISISRADGEIVATAGDIVSMEVVEKPGFNEDVGTVSPHPLAKDMTPKVGKSTTADVSYSDEFAWDVAGNNSYFSEFELANA